MQLVFAVVLIFLVCRCLCTPLQGVLLLDSLSFNKTLRAFPHAVVKFDSGYPAGDAHTLWAMLGNEMSEVNDILLAEVMKEKVR